MFKSPPSEKNIILYADDDLDDLEFVQDAISEYTKNVKLLTSRDGVEALSTLKNLIETDSVPCLIILDINMPRLDGMETLKEIRNIPRLNNVPVVMFTTSSEKLDQKFSNHNNVRLITKPIDYSQMENITNQFLEHCSEEIRNNIRNKR